MIAIDATNHMITLWYKTKNCQVIVTLNYFKIKRV